MELIVQLVGVRLMADMAPVSCCSVFDFSGNSMHCCVVSFCRITELLAEF